MVALVNGRFGLLHARWLVHKLFHQILTLVRHKSGSGLLRLCRVALLIHLPKNTLVYHLLLVEVHHIIQGPSCPQLRLHHLLASGAASTLFASECRTRLVLLLPFENGVKTIVVYQFRC